MRLYPFAFSALPSLLMVVTCLPRAAFAELALVQYPAGTAVRLPAPNVVLSLDDSSSMGSARDSGSNMRALKEALHTIFGANSSVLPDGAIRLGWNTMNQCFAIAANTSTPGCSPVRVLDATHRSRFLTWVGPTNRKESGTELQKESGTPTYKTYAAAGDYLLGASTSDANGPWASVPGSVLEPVWSCRRNYLILMTDGEWNEGTVDRGSGQNTATRITLPDQEQTVYDGASAGARIYRSWSSAPTKSTLADLAFHYWATDFAPALANDVPAIIRHPGPQAVAGASPATTLEEYWNPRNNPSTWQNAATYVIGFGEAASWSGAPYWDAGSNDTYGGDFARLAAGNITWPTPSSGSARMMESWHMALAGRGLFIPVAGGSTDGLIRAFKEIFGAIVADTSRPITSFASSSTSIARTQAMRFTTGYEANGWLGYIRADTLAKITGAATPAEGWGIKAATLPALPHLTTADKLDALSAADLAKRLILTWSDATGDLGPGGTSFQWTADAKMRPLSDVQKGWLKTENVLDFIRGNRSQEGGSMRVRRSRQGDIVNSRPWYVSEPVSGHGFQGYLTFAGKHAKRLPMVYVGGNDGMLHGFSALDGTEKIAYVPRGVMPNLAEFTSTAYKHRYYVDGSPFSGDVNWGDSANPNWRTLLVGTLGAGGKGYFVLDVTNPGSTDSDGIASDMLKINAGKLVVLDATAAAGSSTDDADIGHIMVDPVLEDGNPQKTTQIVRMNDGRWALVLGNGINSRSEKPVLLIQYLDDTKGLLKIPVAVTGANATDNGLSAPRLVDIDGNGTPDIAYAGDLRGNLWKFDLMSGTASEWKVAFGTSSAPLPLYTASHGSGKASTLQPITVAPIVRANDRGAGGLMVAFGTGRNVTEEDRSSQAVQSIYSVLDNTRYKLNSSKKVEIDDSKVTPGVVAGIGELVEQTVGTTTFTGSGSSSTRKFWTTSEKNVTFEGPSAKKGWYLNLPVAGERVLIQMSFYDASNNIELMTLVPARGGATGNEGCEATPAAQTNFRTFVNVMDGKRPSVPIVDLNGDGAYKLDSDKGVSRASAASAESRATTSTHEIRIGSDGVTEKFSKMPEIPLRHSWRQMQ